MLAVAARRRCQLCYVSRARSLSLGSVGRGDGVADDAPGLSGTVCLPGAAGSPPQAKWVIV